MSPLIPHRFLCLVVILGILPGALLRADWPLFRGDPVQDGVALDAKLPERLEVRWKVQFKDGIESTAALVGDTVYVGCFDQHLYALDLATGKEKGKFKTGPIKAPVTVAQGLVLAGTEEGMFFGVDAVTGKKRWEFETNGEITGGANFSGDRVVFGSHDSTLYCLALKEGKLLWKYKTEGPVNGSALVANGQTFMAGCDSNLHVIDLATGMQLAAVELGGQAGATAAARGAHLYVGNMANQVQAIDLKKKDILWTFEPKRAQPFYSSAAVTEKLVVVGCRDRAVYALDRHKGTQVWSFATKGRVDSSPVVVGARVYIGSGDGHLYVLDLATGSELQRLELGRGINASAAVAQDCLVIGTNEGALYCLGKK
jgi:outer membrane protein assembly factor BamB